MLFCGIPSVCVGKFYTLHGRAKRLTVAIGTPGRVNETGTIFARRDYRITMTAGRAKRRLALVKTGVRQEIEDECFTRFNVCRGGVADR
jgi:hypothetical protein